MADPGKVVAGALPYQSGPFDHPSVWGMSPEKIPGAVTKVFRGPDKALLADRSGIIVVLYSPVHFVVTDPAHRKTGFDVTANQYLREIPGAGYDDQAYGDLETGLTDADSPKMCEVPRPDAGDYQIDLTGTADGTYSLRVLTYDQNGLATDIPPLVDIPVQKGERQSLTLSYTPLAGATPLLLGGFDGGGHRPKDVNRFLTYVKPTDSRTTLPSGTTNYSLMIDYGAAILPSTFSAVLNGMDVTAQFHPTPGSFETVALSLQPGSNVLQLSVDGSAGGRLATDIDRLVFDVQ